MHANSGRSRTLLRRALRLGASAGALGALAWSVSPTASSGAATAVKHPTFVYLQTDGSQSYFVLEGDGAKAEASKLGATVKVENESSSSSTTISDIQTGIADHVNGFIVVAPAASLGPRMVSLANAAHVPIMASDNGFAGSNNKQVPFVGIDAAQFGANSGKLMMNFYKALKWKSSNSYMLLITNPALPTIVQRTTAEQKAAIAAGFPKSHIIDVPTTDNTTEQAYTNTGPVKTAHPQAQHWLVTGGNDDVAFGAAKALVAAGVKPQNIDAVGLGGDLACQIWAKGAPNVGFRGTNYIYPNAIGATAVKELYNNVVHHAAFPRNTYVSPIRMTRATLHKVDKAC
ncbi:MAG: substrate-binding domain-containing protein [Actinomycetota bacterium]|nr:substrate-binding domain-containing protein [Actinomycetota bacterium]